MVHLLQEAYDAARNYRYDDKQNEREKMAEKNFYRCLRSNELKNFSNVHYFQHKLEIRKSDLEHKIETGMILEEYLEMLPNFNLARSTAEDRKKYIKEDMRDAEKEMIFNKLKKELQVINEDLEKVY